jgi:hypothetical protein
VQRLGLLCMRRPEAYDAYCARTRAHRIAQRQFIIDNPGCIRLDPELPSEPARLKQKEDRIRILSALGSGVPKLETEAMAWALLMSAAEGAQRRAEREAAEAEARKTSRKGGGSGKSTGGRQAPAPAESPMSPTAAMWTEPETTPAAPVAPAAPASLPTLTSLIGDRDAILAGRVPRRDPSDTVELPLG